MPTLEETYHQGATLDLYAWKVPAPPTSTRCVYSRKPTPTQLNDRYNKSVAERVALPSTPPTVSIALERRLKSSMRRVPHVWTARVQANPPAEATTTHITYPSLLVAKIYDPVFFDDDETPWDDPFHLRDLCISCEIESYRRLEPLQGTEVPRFYGYFAAALPAQQHRTVYILLLEVVSGRDLCAIVPPDVTEKVCARHKDAIIDTTLRLYFNVLACGVEQMDMKSRNVILRSQKHVSQSVLETRFCDTEECLLALDVDCGDLHMVMVDFEMVDFRESNPCFSEQVTQRARIERIKSMYLKKWLENRPLSTLLPRYTKEDQPFLPRGKDKIGNPGLQDALSAMV